MIVRIAGLLLFSMYVAGCGDTIAGKGSSEPEVAKFHQLLKKKQFEAMYEMGSKEFRSASPKEKVTALFAAIDRKLGSLDKSKLVNWSVKTYNLDTTVVLVYDDKFQEGDATETFTFHVSDGKAELVGYNISSFDMLVK